MMKDFERLIEHAFPLKQASLDSVHEKNVRHGHISTLHIWPARRPLAASRAALIATLLPDPGTPEERQELCDKIGGKIVKKIEKKKMPNGQTVEREKEVTEGGILKWGRESENREDLEWFKKEIRMAYEGKAPRVLDPFSGGGAIPLEAMRLGCEVTAIDINPVAWFVLKCTLEYPQRLAGKTFQLPEFILHDEEFMEDFYGAHKHLVGRTKPTKKQLQVDHPELFINHQAENTRSPHADLAWHVRAWGYWMLSQVRRQLAKYYPTYADFEPLDKKNPKAYEKKEMRLVPLNEDGTDNIGALNKEFTAEYLADKRHPRWIAKPTVAYLWARSISCKNCRISIPLLKTLWLAKNERKRILLKLNIEKESNGIRFSIQNNVPSANGNAAAKREHDRRISAGTMSRAGVTCPCCGTISTLEDIRFEGQSGKLGSTLCAVAVEGKDGKEYRLPSLLEMEIPNSDSITNTPIFESIPYGKLLEETPKAGRGASRAFSVDGYGFHKWQDLYTPRQVNTLATFVHTALEMRKSALFKQYDPLWQEAIASYLACAISRTSDYLTAFCVWENGAEEVKHLFMRWALPVTWDYAEGNPLAPIERFYLGGLNSAFRVIRNLHDSSWSNSVAPIIQKQSATNNNQSGFDIIVTDPPYYDAIPYSDLMDFFYLWLRRSMYGMSNEFDQAFKDPLSPKWDTDKRDGELIDDSSRHGDDPAKSKAEYEEGMYRAFSAAFNALKPDGRFVIVFAHKQPDAWETLVSAVIRAGFVVDGSWPIQTEMRGGIRNLGRASLSSSVWLSCKKRSNGAKAGWNNKVIDEMEGKIKTRLREYWDAGIRGPDFVWAATGPALEAYSKHPIVKKADDPNSILTVTEFLNRVRRIVVDFVVGRVLSGESDSNPSDSMTERLDESTAYYLLHRHDFGMDEAPAGSCILYAVSCGLTDKELAVNWDLISYSKGKEDSDEKDSTDNFESEEPEVEETSGSKVKLKPWQMRKSKTMGYQAPGGKPVPLIDRVHRLMHLWREGEVQKVDEYLDEYNLRKNELFKRLVQSVIELSEHASEERILLERISNHIQGKGAVREDLASYLSDEMAKRKERE